MQYPEGPKVFQALGNIAGLESSSLGIISTQDFFLSGVPKL